MHIGAFVWQPVQIMFEAWQAAKQDTDIVPSYQQTQHAWLLSTLPLLVQGLPKDSIAFPNARVCGEGSQRRY